MLDGIVLAVKVLQFRVVADVQNFQLVVITFQIFQRICAANCQCFQRTVDADKLFQVIVMADIQFRQRTVGNAQRLKVIQILDSFESGVFASVQKQRFDFNEFHPAQKSVFIFIIAENDFSKLRIRKFGAVDLDSQRNRSHCRRIYRGRRIGRRRCVCGRRRVGRNRRIGRCIRRSGSVRRLRCRGEYSHVNTVTSDANTVRSGNYCVLACGKELEALVLRDIDLFEAFTVQLRKHRQLADIQRFQPRVSAVQ